MNSQSGKIQIIIENDFVTSRENSQELKITVFERIFSKLIRNQGGIGKIFPIYIKTDKEHYILGIFTLSRTGSASFFPELPQGSFFDHITFGKTLANNNIHLTRVTDSGRKKVSSLKTMPLSNGTHHVITLAFQDLKLLKVAPKSIIYPSVSVEKIELLEDALFTRGGFNGSGILEVNASEGIIVVQIFLIPKSISSSVLQFAKLNNGDFFNYFDINGNMKDIKIHTAFLTHEFQDAYQFGFIAFRCNITTNMPAYMEYAMERSKYYFNSSDSELNKSVDKIRKSNRVED